MARKAVSIIISILAVIGGIYLSYNSINNLSENNKNSSLKAQQDSLGLQMLTECLKPHASNEGYSICDEQLTEAKNDCDTFKQTCADPRMTEYFTMRSAAIIPATVGEQVNPVIESSPQASPSVSAPIDIPATDIRCFSRLSTMFNHNETAFYSAVMYTELGASECEQDRTGLIYNTIGKYDLLRASPDYSMDICGNSRIQYTEYRLLNGTILTFGEQAKSKLSVQDPKNPYVFSDPYNCNVYG